MLQFPGGEAGALQQRAGFIGEDAEVSTLLGGGESSLAPEAQKSARRTLDNLVQRFGYNEQSARDLVAIVADQDYAPLQSAVAMATGENAVSIERGAAKSSSARASGTSLRAASRPRRCC